MAAATRQPPPGRAASARASPRAAPVQEHPYAAIRPDSPAASAWPLDFSQLRDVLDADDPGAPDKRHRGGQPIVGAVATHTATRRRRAMPTLPPLRATLGVPPRRCAATVPCRHRGRRPPCRHAATPPPSCAATPVCRHRAVPPSREAPAVPPCRHAATLLCRHPAVPPLRRAAIVGAAGRAAVPPCRHDGAARRRRTPERGHAAPHVLVGRVRRCHPLVRGLPCPARRPPGDRCGASLLDERSGVAYGADRLDDHALSASRFR